MTQSDLQKLSEQATGGTWRTLLYPINMYGIELADIEEVANGGPVEDGGDYCGALSAADAAFIVALVNAFRDGITGIGATPTRDTTKPRQPHTSPGLSSVLRSTV